jgi:hypothetical protein
MLSLPVIGSIILHVFILPIYVASALLAPAFKRRNNDDET